MDDSVLTSLAIKELMYEKDKNSRTFYGPQERKINPLGRPNTRFLGRTLTDALHHNKRTIERTQAKSKLKLQELDYSQERRKYNAFYNRNKREKYERTEYKRQIRKKSNMNHFTRSSTVKSRSPSHSRSTRHKRKHRKKKKNKHKEKRKSRTNTSNSRRSRSSSRSSSISSRCSITNTYRSYPSKFNRSRRSEKNRNRRSHSRNQINQSRYRRSLSSTSNSKESAPLSRESVERIAPTTDYYYHSNNLALAVAMAYSQSQSSPKESLVPASPSRDIIMELMSDEEVAKQDAQSSDDEDDHIVTINISSHDDHSVCSTIDCESDSYNAYDCIDLDSGSDTQLIKNYHERIGGKSPIPVGQSSHFSGTVDLTDD